MARNWLLTTCRGRLDHLKESLPSWLRFMPNWDPMVVCPDDPAATDYAAETLHAAKRGIVITTTQGQHFNKLEAERVGIELATFALEPIGQCITCPPLPSALGGIETDSTDMIALWDADTVAIRGTERALSWVPPEDCGISSSGCRDDMGFLVTSVGTLAKAVRKIPAGSFVGYGPEDCAIRVACWTETRRPFVKIPACWARRQHSDALRIRHFGHSMAGSGRLNVTAMGELMSRIMKPEDFAICREHCLFGAGPGVGSVRAS